MRVSIPIDIQVEINPDVPGQEGWTHEEMRDELIGYLHNELNARDPGLGWMARSFIRVYAIDSQDVIGVDEAEGNDLGIGILNMDPLAYPSGTTQRFIQAFHGMLDERQSLYQKTMLNEAEDKRQTEQVHERFCPPHSWIRDGSGAVCTHCGREVTEIEKYAPPDVTIDDQEEGM